MENDEIKNGINNENEENSEVSENMEENNSLAEEEKAEEVNIESVESEDGINKEKKGPSLLKKLFSNILDQSLIIALSSILLIIFDFLIKFVGYMVVMPLGVLLIIYFIVNSLYSPIIKNSKLKKTLGEKIFNI